MVAVSAKGFRGQVPRTDNRLLGQQFASQAFNARNTSGRIDPLRGPGLVHTSLASTIGSVFRYRARGATNWLVWPSYVDAAISPTSGDTLNRVFWTGDGEPRMAAYDDAISGGGPYPAGWYVLGVYPPAAAATIAVTGGALPVEVRSYVYTFVTRYGEESPPSPATVYTGNANGTWNLSGMSLPPANTGTVTGATANTPVVGQVTVQLNSAYGIMANEEITLAGVGGMTALNGKRKVLSVSGNNVVVALSTAQTYTSGGTWSRVAPHNLTAMKKRIYRTIADVAEYKFVAEINATDTGFADTVAATALGEPLPTLDADLPPKDGHSLTELANGSFACLSGNQLCFSVPFKPYLWPQAYRYSFSGQGVALSTATNVVIVLREAGKPIIASATLPDSVSMADADIDAACVSKASVVDIGNGCIYASTDGLYMVGPAGVRNITAGLYTFEEWKQLRPDTFKAAYFDQHYYAMHETLEGDEEKILRLSLDEPDSIWQITEQVDLLYSSDLDAALYAVKGNKIYEWDADDANRYLASWRGPTLQLGSPVNFSVAQVHANFGEILPVDDSITQANQLILANADNVDGEIASAEVLTYEVCASALLQQPSISDRIVQFSLIRDGQVVFTKTLNSSKAFKLPAGKKSEIWSYEVAANVSVRSIAMATSMEELTVAGA